MTIRRPGPLALAAALLLPLLAVAPPPASAGVTVYDFPLWPAADIISPGYGEAEVTFDDGTNTVAWNIQFHQLAGEAFACHFHGPAASCEQAGVRVNLTPTLMLKDPGNGSLVGDAVITASQAAELTAGLWYINLHTTFAPDGELRGQVLDGDPCPADLNATCTVNFGDLINVLGAWGPCSGGCHDDLDGSGDVGFSDLLILLSQWGPCP